MQKVRRPITIIFFPFLTGIILNHTFHLFSELFSYTCILSAVFISGIISFKYKNSVKAFLVLLAFVSGCFYNFLENDIVPTDHIINRIKSGEDYFLAGTVVSIPQEYEDRTSFIINAEKLEKDGRNFAVTGKVQVNIYDGGTQVDYGDRLKFYARIVVPRGAKNPGGFDYQKFLKHKGILLVARIKNDLFIADRIGGAGNSFLEWIYGWRKMLINKINENFIFPNSSMLVATLFGERSSLTEEIEKAFKYSGTYHIFAISGFNIGLVGFIFYMFFRIIGCSPSTASFPSIIAVVFYSLLAGMEPSVKRAMIMALVYFVSVIIKRENNLYNTLCVAAFIILVIEPNAVFDIGFILTFAATFFIIYLTPKFDNVLKFIPFRYVRGLVSASLSAQIGVTPVLAFYFNNISLTGVLANLVAVPLASLIFGTGILFFFCLSLPSILLSYSVKALDLMLSSMLEVVEFFSRLPFSYIRVFTPGLFEILLFYVLIFLIVSSKGKKLLQVVLIAFAVILTCSLCINLFPSLGSDELKITFLDVGEGDSAFIEFPDGKTALIDGGGTYDDKFDVGEKVVTPYLLFSRIRTIDYVVLTHPHPDHMNGIKAVLNNFRVKNFLEGCAINNSSPNYSLIKKMIQERNIPQKRVMRGEEFKIGENILIRFLNPSEKLCERGNGFFKNINDQSLAFQVIYKKFRILFTGDIEKEAIEDIISRDTELRSTVIKVPHHGGKVSVNYQLVKRVLPKIAVISVGTNNSFSHPSKETLEDYKKSGAKIYRTDINGAVMLRTDGVRV
ncbi:MAG: DNA internalization-related competence protein ComEC/Rec2, partial [Candidatus Schekmanbacteria bacterium RBG_16_38_10]